MNAELFAAKPTKGEQAKKRLLLAALEKIGDRGYENASVREIADAAEQNVASIAYYFGSKENLYREVINGIVEYFNSTFGEIASEARGLFESGEMTPDRAAGFLKKMLRAVLTEHIGRDEFLKVRNVMMREQASPSGAFDVLYEKGLKPLHTLFTRTLAVASGESPDSQRAIIRAHSLFGQVIGFTVARSTILKRLGLKTFKESHSEVIAGVIDEHIEFICEGLARKGGKA